MLYKRNLLTWIVVLLCGLVVSASIAQDIPPRRVKLTGIIHQDKEGNFTFDPDGSTGQRLKISNKESTRPALDVPVEVVGEKTTASTLEVERSNSVLLVDWGNAKDHLSSSRFQAVHSAFEKARASLAEARTQTKSATDRAKDFVMSVEPVEEAVGAALLRDDIDDTERAALTKLAQRAVRDSHQSKAQYHQFKSEYRPESYASIHSNSKSIVAIAPQDDKPFCTGVLVGEDLILTCHHCTAQYPLETLEARFNYENDLTGRALAIDIYTIDSRVAYDATLDFTLLKVKPNAGVPPSAKWPIQTLSSKFVALDESVYVIGHPRGDPRAVADNAHVNFPSDVGEEVRNQLATQLTAQYSDTPEFKALWASFRESYVLYTTPPAENRYRYIHSGHETIGADCDTFHGNSGSPVFSRKTHKVIGLLYAGQDDIRDPFTAGWRYHEYISAIKPIGERIKSKVPDYLTRKMKIE